MLRLICATIVALALGVLTATATAAPPRADCSSPGRLLEAHDGAAISNAKRGQWYGLHGCLDGRRAWHLGSNYGWAGGPRLLHVLAPPYAVVGWRECERGGCFGVTSLTDLRTGRHVRAGLGDTAYRTYGRLLAQRDGLAAWSMVVDPEAGGGGEIHVLTGDGAHATVDSGPEVDASSLALIGRRLVWMHGDAVRSHRAAPSAVTGGERQPRGKPATAPAAAPCGRGRLVAATRDAALSVAWHRYHPRLWGCVTGHRPVELGISSLDLPQIRRPRLGGRFAGFVDLGCDKGECLGTTVLVDLVDRRRAVAPTEGFAPRAPRALVVSRHGFMAWSFDDEIRLLRIDGTTELLDEGPDVDERSLALAGRRLYWLRDGAVQTRLVA